MQFPSADSRSSTRCTTTSSGSALRMCSSSWSVVVLGKSSPFLLPGGRRAAGVSSGRAGEPAGRPGRGRGRASVRTCAHPADDPGACDGRPHDGYRLRQLRLEHAVEVHRAADRRERVLVRQHAEDADVRAVLKPAAGGHGRLRRRCKCRALVALRPAPAAGRLSSAAAQLGSSSSSTPSPGSSTPSPTPSFPLLPCSVLGKQC